MLDLSAIRDTLASSAGRVLEWLSRPVLSIGGSSISTGTILTLVVYVGAVVWVARVLRRVILRRVLPAAMRDGASEPLANGAFYAFLALGIIVGFQAAGVDLSTLTVLFGALGVGIGFGLQTIASNFISGLIIHFEKPIRIGDRIQIGDLNGRVQRIGSRATEVVTNDNISVIVPNLEFISNQVVNWSHGDARIRIHVPVGVAYGSEIDTVCKALIEAAESVPAVLKDPPPRVWMTRFGESSIEFELLGWTSDLLHSRGEFISQLNFSIHRSLANYGIQIPFPQRDVHVRSSDAAVSRGAKAP